ncbi:prolyl oligopeptidase family serine peptidase [Phenylobacterium sp.]|uniref:S9 family peptidase n=1 Tax=Phenylobacterium sp. TaxID=1871053 RepID=UPI0035AE1096
MIQTEAAYDTAARFDFDQFSAPLLGRLKIADVGSGRPAHDLIAPEPGAGYLAGPISPSGRSMAVQRLKGGDWDTGVVDLATGQARWLKVPAETAVWGRSLQWRSETRLIALALAPGQMPLRLRTIRQTTGQLTALWRAAALGGATTREIGSGRDLRVWPKPVQVRLAEIDVTTGVVHDLARGAFIDFELSPDGRYAAVLANTEPEQPGPDDLVRVGTPGRRRVLQLVDLVTGAVSAPLPDRDLLSHLLAWSPRGDRLLVFGRKAGAAWSEGDFLTVDAPSGAVATPALGRASAQVDVPNAGGVSVARGAWMGDAPVVYGHLAGAASERADWIRLGHTRAVNLTASLPTVPAHLASANEHHLDLVADGALFRIDASGHAARLLKSPGLKEVASPKFGDGDRLDINAPPGAGGFWVQDGAVARHVLAAQVDPPLALGPGQQLIASSDVALGLKARDAQGVTEVSIRTSTGLWTVAAVNSRLAEVDPTPVLPIRHNSPGGRAVTSWLYLPPPLSTVGRKPPLIVLPYPGAAYDTPPGRYAPDALVFTPNARLLAAHGFAVLAPSLPADHAPGEPAEGLADQVLAEVDAVLAQGLADRDRLALWGHSYGGYGALVIGAETNRFKAIIAQAAKTDLAAGWGVISPFFRANPDEGPMLNGDIGWTESGQGGLGVPPWRDPDRYRRNSPFFLADRIQTPVLLIQGDQDFVALSQAEAMFAALYRQGRDARLMTLFGEGHVIGSPANVRAIYETALPWLDRALNGPAGLDGAPSSAPRASAAPISPSP